VAPEQGQPVEIVQTKRTTITIRQTPLDNERGVREMLAQKVSGSSAGLWLLIPELQRLGAWELLKGWTGGDDRDLDPRIALQMVFESALCTARVRRKNSLSHQGFSLAAGLAGLVSDQQVHRLCEGHTIGQARQLLVQLGLQRRLSGHYKGRVVAVDPHRMISRSRRMMAKKKKHPDQPAQKMLQTFFSVCAHTGQPITAYMGSSGIPTGLATQTLVEDTARILPRNKLLVADKEHFTCQLLEDVAARANMDLLVPALHFKHVKATLESMSYRRVSAGFAIGEVPFRFAGGSRDFRLLGQRTGERPGDYQYQGFVTTSGEDPAQLLCRDYPKRWSVEEFFHFENKMGLTRAGTLNLHIRYGKLALAMIAQAGTYQLRQNLATVYRSWNAEHLAREILGWADGDIRVKGDTILVTFYGDHNHLDPSRYENLPRILQAEGVDPRIPWLYNFKLDFRFR
jgi:hypothetical protein